MSQYFEKNEKEHQMKTRNEEKFKVSMAHTEKMKKSPIIYMQRLLNKS